jgi:hypothetical protein
VTPCGVFTPPLLWFGPFVCKSSTKLADWLLLPFWFTPMCVATGSLPPPEDSPLCVRTLTPLLVWPCVCESSPKGRAGGSTPLPPPPSQSAGPASATPLRPREPGDTPPSPPPPKPTSHKFGLVPATSQQQAFLSR